MQSVRKKRSLPPEERTAQLLLSLFFAGASVVGGGGGRTRVRGFGCTSRGVPPDPCCRLRPRFFAPVPRDVLRTGRLHRAAGSARRMRRDQVSVVWRNDRSADGPREAALMD